jgi:hypothetical protein
VRVWAPVCMQEGDWQRRWFELARPQIHGHDINSVALLPRNEHVLLSGAEEKTIRVFAATESFVTSLLNVTGLKTEGIRKETKKQTLY